MSEKTLFGCNGMVLLQQLAGDVMNENLGSVLKADRSKWWEPWSESDGFTLPEALRSIHGRLYQHHQYDPECAYRIKRTGPALQAAERLRALTRPTMSEVQLAVMGWDCEPREIYPGQLAEDLRCRLIGLLSGYMG